MALTDDQVRMWLRLPGTDDADLIAEVTSASNALAVRLPLVEAAEAAGEAWPADVMHGVLTLAARLYRRRNSPQGLESSQDGMIYVPRRDSDVDRFLGINRPRVG